MDDFFIMDFAHQLQSYQARINDLLTQAIDPRTPEPLASAMAYALTNGGKRIRPALVYAAGALSRASAEALDKAALAIEMLHSYSLVHDDLPAMDDDDLRRGKPTTHIAFDEATAILAGDALQAHAFATLCQSPIGDQAKVSCITALAQAAGSLGMVGGQVLDMQGEGKALNQAALEQIHRLKTGALIQCALTLGTLAGEDHRHMPALEAYGRLIGLAFQVHDDILDMQGNSTNLGKTPGKDQIQDKTTYPKLLGLTASCDYRDQLIAQAQALLPPEADFLHQLAAYIGNRHG